eukprot:SAG31_NODE_44_length_31168_cov_16.507290_9_plen_169_part_00
MRGGVPTKFSRYLQVLLNLTLIINFVDRWEIIIEVRLCLQLYARVELRFQNPMTEVARAIKRSIRPVKQRITSFASTYGHLIRIVNEIWGRYASMEANGVKAGSKTRKKKSENAKKKNEMDALSSAVGPRHEGIYHGTQLTWKFVLSFQEPRRAATAVLVQLYMDVLL